MSQVKVDTGVIIFKNNQVLLGHRINSHGHGTWCFPGGHLEWNETPLDCVIRETHEETGLTLDTVIEGPWTNDIFDIDNKHYVTLLMLAQYSKGEPQIKEPEKCLEWRWFDFNSLPQSLFLPIKNLLEKTSLESLQIQLLNEILSHELYLYGVNTK